METYMAVKGQKITINKSLKNLKRPEFEINVKIEIPEMQDDLRKRYLDKYNRLFLPKKKKLLNDWLKSYNDGVKFLDEAISKRVKTHSLLCKNLTKRVMKDVTKDKGQAKKLSRMIKDFDDDAVELKAVIDAFGPTLRNGVATLQSQLETLAVEVRDSVEKFLGKELKHKKSANKKKWIKVAIVIGIVLIGVAIAIAAVATGGLVGVALGIAITALAVSGIYGLVKDVNVLRNSLKAETGKVQQHLERFDKAITAMAKEEGKRVEMSYLSSKKPSKSCQVHWKSCLASMKKLDKHTKRMDEMSFKLQIHMREKTSLIKDVENNLKKASTSYQNASSAVKQYDLPTDHENANKKMTADVIKLKAGIRRALAKVDEINDLKKAVQELKDDLNAGRKSIEKVSGSQKRCVRALKYTTSLFGILDTVTSKAAGAYSTATG